MEINFVSKRVLVTGAGRGIGRELVRKLLDCGAEVVAVSRTKEHLDSLRAEVGNKPLTIINADIGNWDAAQAAARDAGPIDCLVNNAGISILNSFVNIMSEDFDKCFSINVKGLIALSQGIVRGMIDRKKGGSIVNVSSQASQAALSDHTVYAGTKGAVDMVTRVMALELGPHNIRVNAVNPTVTITAMGKMAWSYPEKGGHMLDKIPLRRFAEVDEIVYPIIYLLSDKSSMINGVTLPVDGGFLAC